MLSCFQASYQRVDASLQRLVDSVAAYNPSPSAAKDLLAADSVVDANLNTLISHQHNHQHLQNLRETAASLDESIKTTIRLLSDTRKQIRAIRPSSSSRIRTNINALALSSSDSESLSGRDVDVEALLVYARFIGKSTVPPTLRRSVDLPYTSDATARHSAIAPTMNGSRIATPAQHTSTPSPNMPNASCSSILPLSTTSWLDVASSLPWSPWPSHETISASALADIQKMIENGQDPAAVLSIEELAEAETRKAEEEAREREKQREEDRRRRDVFDTGTVRRGTLVSGAETVAFNPDDL